MTSYYYLPNTFDCIQFLQFLGGVQYVEVDSHLFVRGESLLDWITQSGGFYLTEESKLWVDWWDATPPEWQGDVQHQCDKHMMLTAASSRL